MNLLSFITDPVTSKLRLVGLAVGVGLLAGLLAMAAYFWHDYQSQKKDLQAEKVQNATLQGTNSNLVTTVKNDEKSAAVNDATQAKVDTGKKVIEEKVDDIAKAHSVSVQKIEKKYEALPQTADNTRAKEVEMSADRMTRLWQVFCIPTPNNKDCEANIGNAASASLAASAASK